MNIRDKIQDIVLDIMHDPEYKNKEANVNIIANLLADRISLIIEAGVDDPETKSRLDALVQELR